MCLSNRMKFPTILVLYTTVTTAYCKFTGSNLTGYNGINHCIM